MCVEKNNSFLIEPDFFQNKWLAISTLPTVEDCPHIRSCIPNRTFWPRKKYKKMTPLPFTTCNYYKNHPLPLMFNIICAVSSHWLAKTNILLNYWNGIFEWFLQNVRSGARDVLSGPQNVRSGPQCDVRTTRCAIKSTVCGIRRAKCISSCPTCGSLLASRDILTPATHRKGSIAFNSCYCKLTLIRNIKGIQSSPSKGTLRGFKILNVFYSFQYYKS